MQSNSLKSNSLTLKVKEGPQDAVHELKLISLSCWSFWAQAQSCDIHHRPLSLNYYFATINVKRQAHYIWVRSNTSADESLHRFYIKLHFAFFLLRPQIKRKADWYVLSRFCSFVFKGQRPQILKDRKKINTLLCPTSWNTVG